LLATLRGYYALKTGYERGFDDITLLASRFYAAALVLRPGPARACRRTVSLGIAAYPEHRSTPEELLVEAEQALYLAKGGGRNRVVIAPRGLDYREQLPLISVWRRVCEFIATHVTGSNWLAARGDSA
jgi:hypothetical protein